MEKEVIMYGNIYKKGNKNRTALGKWTVKRFLEIVETFKSSSSHGSFVIQKIRPKCLLSSADLSEYDYSLLGDLFIIHW